MSDPANTPRPPRRVLKWTVRIGAALIVILGLILLIAPMLVNSLVRPRVAAAINAEINGEASIGEMRFSWSDGLTIEGLSISNPPGFAKGDAVNIGRVHVNPSIISLMSSKLSLKDDLRVEKVRLNIEQNAKSELNLAKLVRTQPAKKPKAEGSMKPKAPAASSNTMSVQGGMVLDDLVVSLKTPALAAPAALSPLHIDARIEGLEKPVTFAVKNSDLSLSVKGDASFGARLLANLDYVITPAFLTPLKPALASIGPVKKFDGDLSGRGHLSLGDPKATGGKGDLILAIKTLVVEAADAKGKRALYELQPGNTALNFESKPVDGKADFIAHITAPATRVELKGLTDGASYDGTFSFNTDLSELSRCLAGLIPADAKLQGRITASSTRLRADAKSIIADLSVRGENLAGGKMKPIREIDARFTLNSDLEKQAHAVESSLDLATLREIAISLGVMPPGSELSGGVRLVANAHREGENMPFQALLEGTKVHFKGPQQGGASLDEPQPVIKLSGLIQPGKAGTLIKFSDGSTVNMQMMRGTLNGALRQTADQGFVAENLVFDVTYDPARLNPLLAAYSAGKIVAEGPQRAQIKFDGPLQPGDDMTRWLRLLKADNQLGFTAYSNAGVTLEGEPLKASLNDGRLPIDYACKINKGPLTAKGTVRLTGPESDLAVKIDGMNINAEMSSWLGFLSPILGEGKSSRPALSGTATAQFKGRWKGALVESAGPKGASPDYLALAAERLNGEGSFAVANLRVSGSPLLLALNALAGNMGETLGEVQPSGFVIDHGALRYENMVVILSGQKFVFSGVIHVDQRMDMQITMPFPARLLRDRRMEKYVSTITIPLTGTISAPRLDAQAVIQMALKKAAGEALKEGIGGALDGKFGNGAGDILKGIFGGKK